MQAETGVQMNCMFCGAPNTRVLGTEMVVNNRHRVQARRRECGKCGQRFSTKEVYWHRSGTGYRKPKRRSVRSHNAGTSHGNSFLVDDNIYEIRRLSDRGFTYPEIAEKFGISVSHAGSIARRQRWKHLPEQ